MFTRSVTSSASHPASASAVAQPVRAGRRRPSAAGGDGVIARSQQVGDGLEGQPVAVAAEADDAARSPPARPRCVPPRLAGVRVGEVQLDDRAVERGERVVDAPGVVGEGAGVDDDGGAAAAGRVDGVDELALVVRLEVLEREAVRARPRPWRVATWSASVAVP